MIYLASPYSHPNASKREKRYFEAAKQVAWMIERRMWTYSPIVYCHNWAKDFKLPYEAATWIGFNTDMLSLADELFILNIDGWQDSVGIYEEVKIFHQIKRDSRIFIATPQEPDYEAMRAIDVIDLMAARRIGA